MEFLKRLWHGEWPLMQVCLGFWFGVGALFNAIYAFGSGQTEQFTTAGGIVLLGALMLFGIVYWPFISVSIWRSATNYSGHVVAQIAGYFIAILTVGLWAWGVLQILFGG